MVSRILTSEPRPFTGERIVFSTMVLDQLNIYMQKNELGPLPHIMYRINAKQIKDHNIGAEPIKLLEGNIGINHCDFGLGSVFLDITTPKAQVTKERVDKLDFIKLKTSVLKILSRKGKGSPHNGRKYCYHCIW